MKKNINKISLIGIIVQFIITIACLIIGILCIFVNKKFFDVLQIVLATDLIVIGINNYTVYKKKNLTIMYLLFGIIMLIIGILSMLGVV